MLERHIHNIDIALKSSTFFINLLHTFVGLKQTISILLLFVFSFNIVGVVTVFKLQQFQIRRGIKRQIKRGLSEDDLHVITIHPKNSADLDWQEENEFIYKGDMFDIVKKEIRSDSSIVYYCINDKQEKSLFANLDEQVKKQTDRNSPTNQLAKKFFKFLSSIPLQEKNESASVEQNSSKLISLCENNYTSPEVGIEAPPPKFFAISA